MTTRTLNRLRLHDGFTLIEMLVVMAILGIVVSSLATVFSMAVRSNDQIRDQSTLQTEVRAAVDQLTRELRQAYSGDSTVPILTATGTALEFVSPDFQTPFHDRRIAYQLSSGAMQRAITTSTNTNGPPWNGWTWSSFGGIPASAWAQQVDHVRNTTLFTYYDSSGAPLTGSFPLSSIDRVVVTVTVSTTEQASRQFTYSQSASIRWVPE